MRAPSIGFGSALLVALPMAWVACTADSPVDAEPEDGGVEAASEEDAGREEDTGADSGKDAGKDAGKDSGKDTGTDGSVAVVDSGMDSGAAGPVPGTACPTPGTVVTTACGACGKRDIVCEATKTWSPYGFCYGEVAGGCIAGSTRMAACGKCGTTAEVCTSTCAWVSGACTGEPVGACTPGEKKYLTAGCVTPETYREVTCEATCTFGAPAPLPCAGLPPDLEISQTLDETVFVDSALSPLTVQIGRPSSTVGTCPLNVSAVMTSYKYLVIHNSSAQSVVANIWADKVNPGDVDIDTMMAIYTPPFPSTVAERQACFTKYNTLCNTGVCRPGQSFWPGLANLDAPTIAPGGTIVVYVAAVSGTLTTTFRLFVHTKQLI